MTKIVVDIKDCGECPFFESERIYTSDSFDMLFKWTCTKAERVITGCHDTWDKTPIPEWCPCQIKVDNSESIIKKILKSNIVFLNDKVIKSRTVKEVTEVTTADIRDAEVVSYDKNTKTLYLKTKK